MESWKLGIAIFGSVAVAQSIFLGTLLFFKMRLRHAPILWLSVLLFGMALRIGKSIFYYLIPAIGNYGVALGGAGLFIIGPALYFFLKSSQERQVGKTTIIYHFLPAFFMAWTWIYFQSFYPLYLLGTIHLSIYFFISYNYFFHKEWNGKRKSVVYLLATVGIILAIFATQMLAANIQWYTIGSALSCLVLYALNFYIMGDKDFFRIPKKVSKPDHSRHYPKLVEELNQLFQNRKVYRQKGLTLSIVANKLERPTYLVSQVIKEHFQLKFNDFVNQFRVEEVKDKLIDPECNLTIEAIAMDAGFSSTSSLYQAFKKLTGVTPQAFRKAQLHKQQTLGI